MLILTILKPGLLLKMDEKDRELLDSAPDEGDEQPERKVVGLER